MPLHKLVGEACVIDVPEWGKNDPDYLISIDDVRKWEMVSTDKTRRKNCHF